MITEDEINNMLIDLHIMQKDLERTFPIFSGNGILSVARGEAVTITLKPSDYYNHNKDEENEQPKL